MTHVQKLLVLCAFSFGVFFANTIAKADTGIGIQFGHPGNVGLSLRFDNLAIGAAWGFEGNGYLHGTIDLWMLKNNLAENLDWFLGPGADVGIGDPFTLAARLPIGLQWMPSNKIEVFGLAAPGLQLINSTKFYIAGTVGVRFIL